MPYYFLVVAYVAGVVTTAFGVLMGAFIMFRGKVTPGIGEGFLKDPKGEVFNMPDDRMFDEPGATGEPSKDEQRMLDKAKGFLKVLGGGE